MKKNSMRKKLILMTIVPITAVLLAAGIIGTSFVSENVRQLAYDGETSAAALAASNIRSELESIEEIVIYKSHSVALHDFLKTITDRDEITENEYYSYAMGELDSAVSEQRHIIHSGFIASFRHDNIMFENSASGWSAPEDFNISAMPYFAPLTSGSTEIYVTPVYKNPSDGQMITTVAGAVRNENTGEAIGVFGINISLSCYSDIISNSNPENKFSIVITDNTGTVAYSPYTEDIMKASAESIGLNITSGSAEDTVTYIFKNTEMAGHQLQIEDYTIYALSPMSNITEIVSDNVLRTIVIYTVVLIIIVLILTYMAGVLSEPISDYSEQLRKINLDVSPDTELDTEQLLRPKGYYEIETLAKTFNDLFIRNAEMVKTLKEMNLTSERERRLYQTALESSSDVVFEYDIATDKMTTYGSFFDKNVPKTTPIVYSSFLGKIYQSRDNSEAAKEQASLFFGGNCSKPVQICQSCIKNREKKKVWIILEGTAVTDNGRAVKIIGKVSNADQVMMLKSEAETDALTGFLNKMSTESYIASCIEAGSGERGHAMALIDIDNFKAVNDNLGHSMGDAVLKEIACKLRYIFRDDDILGRIGGDEFMVFIKNVSDIDALTSICTRVCSSIKKDFECKDKNITISSSIGIALFPAHGNSFTELYSAADIAMYHTKINGKDGFTIYDGHERVEYKSQRLEY
ncbi:MAG: GGDEF domain-containing protein [Oscillospiraceae bacterium]|nr:GGDEF domain-containing protein [Oscillospiraceae bacterium]